MLMAEMTSINDLAKSGEIKYSSVSDPYKKKESFGKKPHYSRSEMATIKKRRNKNKAAKKSRNKNRKKNKS